jgi:hypothetical protein
MPKMLEEGNTRMLYADDLARAGCDEPDCPHTDHSALYLHGRCHPKSRTWTVFERHTGRLRVECGTGRQLIAYIAVAQRPAAKGVLHA